MFFVNSLDCILVVALTKRYFIYQDPWLVTILDAPNGWIEIWKNGLKPIGSG